MSTVDIAAPLSPTEAAALFSDLADLPGLLLAVSGGPDSTALMVIMARWRGGLRHGPDLLAATVDHALRRGSREEALRVGQLAARLGIPHQILAWRDEKPRSGIQEAARRARYGLLARAARRAGVRHIVTAHTRDDQAETVLFRLARGSGIGGLGGMSRFGPVPGAAGDLTLVRPLLDVPKTRLIATLERAGVAYEDDPSNRDPRFARARFRAVMPALAAEGLNSATLSRAAERARRADAALEWAAEEVIRQRPKRESKADVRPIATAMELQSWPAEIALRVLRRHIEAEGHEGPVELGKLEALFAALLTAAAAGQRRWRRTLAGAAVTLQEGCVLVEAAPPRRRGREATPRVRAAAVAARLTAARRRAINK